MSDRILVTVTGRDRPGITAALTQVLDDNQVRLVDVDQVVVQGRLTLCLVIELASPRPPGEHVVKDLLFTGKKLGLDVDFDPLENAADEERLDVVVTLISQQVNAGDLGALASTLSRFGANVERIQRLTDEDLAAVELLASIPAGHDAQSLKRALLDLSDARGIDVAVQRDDVFRRSKRLVAMDMDSTLIRIEVIDELANAAGVGEKVAEITRRAMAGELDFEQSLRARVALLAGLETRVLHELSDNLPLTDGAETLVRAARRLGLKTAVISGGFDIGAQALQKRLGLDYAFSNTLEERDGRLTGKLLGAIVDARRKADLLEQIARSEGIALDQTVAIGDGANDREMLQRAGLGVAFHAKPRVREAAHTALTGGLERVLYLLGMRARDIRAVSAEG